MKNLVDLHTHTVFSNHAFSSLTENIKQACDIGLLYYGWSDHQPDSVGMGGKKFNFSNTKVIPSLKNETHILKGIELNICDDFKESVDYFKGRLEYGIASMHQYAYSNTHTCEENTKRALEACNEDFIKILGHIDDGNFPIDYYQVIKECKKTNTLVEFNNSSLLPGGCRINSLENFKIMIDICKDLKCPIIMNSDAHICYDVGNVELVAKLLADNDFDPNLIVNYNINLFKEYFN